MSGPKRTISAAPPPRRAAVPIDLPGPASEEAGEGGHELNLGGFASPVSTPPAREQSAQAAPAPRRAAVPIDLPGPASAEAGEGGHELNLGGLTSPDGTPLAGERSAQAAPARRGGAAPIDLPGPASEEAGEGGHELNPGGLTSPESTAPAGERSAQAAPEGRRVSATGMTKTTVQLPNWLVGRLRAWRRATGRSNADAMLTAYLNRLQAVQERHAPADDDRRRAELGLRPLAATLPPPPPDTAEERPVQVGLYVRAAAVDEVDAAARAFGLSRSQFVAELLAAELDGAEPHQDDR